MYNKPSVGYNKPSVVYNKASVTDILTNAVPLEQAGAAQFAVLMEFTCSEDFRNCISTEPFERTRMMPLHSLPL